MGDLAKFAKGGILDTFCSQTLELAPVENKEFPEKFQINRNGTLSMWGDEEKYNTEDTQIYVVSAKSMYVKYTSKAYRKCEKDDNGSKEAVLVACTLILPCGEIKFASTLLVRSLSKMIYMYSKKMEEYREKVKNNKAILEKLHMFIGFYPTLQSVETSNGTYLKVQKINMFEITKKDLENVVSAYEESNFTFEEIFNDSLEHLEGKKGKEKE